ncbi:MAG TPA: tRNA dihydrouridine synthase DusB [Pirellulales bacterium]|jgi:tRNA-dihydrouridine synthase B|nr:tRNA dihydrouridine synthase DusB [Pirellulales bacterium]
MASTTAAASPTELRSANAHPSALVQPLAIGPVVVDPPVLQAPMAGFTNFAYRQMVREFGGAGLQATEMVHAKGFLWLEREEEELPDRLWGVADEPRPLAVQIWDNDPQTLAEVGAKLAHEMKVSVVDINFGCPVKQVTEKAHSGSYLLRFPDRVGAIVERVVRACAPTPVTAKIRLGCTRSSINAIEVAQVIEQAGAAALTVHGRTAQDFFSGSADWERIAEIKPHLRRIPLIGNGDLHSVETVLAAFARYPVDGVMIARAALNRPWLFRQVRAALRGEPIPPDPTLAEERALLVHHYELVCERFGPAKGTILMRKYACCYAQGRTGAREFRTQVSHVATPAEFHATVERYFPRQKT